MWPVEDNRNFFEVLLPKLKAAAEKFDMVPCPQQQQFGPQPWRDDENHLPGMLEPYFLKNAIGPAYVLGGTVCRPLATTLESNGRFAIACIEGSVRHGPIDLFGGEHGRISFDNIHHAFQVIDGRTVFDVGDSRTQVNAGELLYVPKGSKFRFQVLSRFAKMYVFCNGGGLVELMMNVGKSYSSPVIPEKAEDFGFEVLMPLQGSFGGFRLR